jgi:hypothetical protein
MLPYSNKNTFDYENYCSYGSWQISAIDSGGVRESRREILQRVRWCREIIAISVTPRVVGFFYRPYAGKSIYEKKNREKYHGGKNEM